MSENFVVIDEWIAKETSFSSESDADAFVDARRTELHKIYCVDKSVVLEKCLCTHSGGLEECATHAYRRTVQPHELDECKFKDDIFVQS